MNDTRKKNHTAKSEAINKPAREVEGSREGRTPTGVLLAVVPLSRWVICLFTKICPRRKDKEKQIIALKKTHTSLISKNNFHSENKKGSGHCDTGR